MKNAILYPLLLLSVLVGCHPTGQQENIASHVVSQIRIESENHPQLTLRIYTDGQKINRILRYIRSLDKMPTAKAAAEDAQQPSATITLVRADGSRKQYRQWGNLYFQGDNAVWKQLPLDTGAQFWDILLQTPSDPT